jgi:hypothetical protein
LFILYACTGKENGLFFRLEEIKGYKNFDEGLKAWKINCKCKTDRKPAANL